MYHITINTWFGKFNKTPVEHDLQHTNVAEGPCVPTGVSGAEMQCLFR